MHGSVFIITLCHDREMHRLVSQLSGRPHPKHGDGVGMVLPVLPISALNGTKTAVAVQTGAVSVDAWMPTWASCSLRQGVTWIRNGVGEVGSGGRRRPGGRRSLKGTGAGMAT